MALSEDLPNLTGEQKFIMMLLERLETVEDKLTDNVQVHQEELYCSSAKSSLD